MINRDWTPASELLLKSLESREATLSPQSDALLKALRSRKQTHFPHADQGSLFGGEGVKNTEPHHYEQFGAHKHRVAGAAPATPAASATAMAPVAENKLPQSPPVTESEIYYVETNEPYFRALATASGPMSHVDLGRESGQSDVGVYRNFVPLALRYGLIAAKAENWGPVELTDKGRAAIVAFDKQRVDEQKASEAAHSQVQDDAKKQVDNRPAEDKASGIARLPIQFKARLAAVSGRRVYGKDTPVTGVQLKYWAPESGEPRLYINGEVGEAKPVDLGHIKSHDGELKFFGGRDVDGMKLGLDEEHRPLVMAAARQLFANPPEAKKSQSRSGGMQGQLWQPCPRCGEEPVCANCHYCSSHCRC